jgi:hypothetical protein
MSETKPLIYVAGPYSADPIAGTRDAVRAAATLNRSGAVFALCPHTSLLADLVEPMPYDHWIALDLELVERCDAVLRVPGESPGADREVELARSLGMPVFTSAEDAIAWGEGFGEEGAVVDDGEALPLQSPIAIRPLTLAEEAELVAQLARLRPKLNRGPRGLVGRVASAERRSENDNGTHCARCGRRKH